MENILPNNSQNFFPEELKNQFNYILINVLTHFMAKYYKEQNVNSNNALGDLDNWIKRNLDEKFLLHYKSDIQYVFSYLALLKFKDMLFKL